MIEKKNIFKALSLFQQECPVILKDTKGYNYKYADLPAILEIINPLLKKHGLGFTQMINGKRIDTILFHVESGETLESKCYIPFESIIYEDVVKTDKTGKTFTSNLIKGFEGMNKAQAIGSLITYFRRYTISTMLGIITDKDTDGTGVQKEKIETVIEKIFLSEKNFQNLLKSQDVKKIENYVKDCESNNVAISDTQIREIHTHINKLKK